MWGAKQNSFSRCCVESGTGIVGSSELTLSTSYLRIAQAAPAIRLFETSECRIQGASGEAREPSRVATLPRGHRDACVGPVGGRAEFDRILLGNRHAPRPRAPAVADLRAMIVQSFFAARPYRVFSSGIRLRYLGLSKWANGGVEDIASSIAGPAEFCQRLDDPFCAGSRHSRTAPLPEQDVTRGLSVCFATDSASRVFAEYGLPIPASRLGQLSRYMPTTAPWPRTALTGAAPSSPVESGSPNPIFPSTVRAGFPSHRGLDALKRDFAAGRPTALRHGLRPAAGAPQQPSTRSRGKRSSTSEHSHMRKIGSVEPVAALTPAGARSKC